MMYQIYRWLYNQFAFSRSQSNGFLILLPLSLIVVISEPVWRYYKSHQPRDFTAESRFLDSIMAVHFQESTLSGQHNQTTDSSGVDRVISFNPNTASAAELQALGFAPDVADRIVRYAQKGGRFTNASDLLKIHGIDTGLVRSLIPFIHITSPIEQKGVGTTLKKKDIPVQRQQTFDINLADTTQLRSVRGIGSKLSARIVRYRDALGGFHSLNQLYEVYMLDSAVVRELKKVTYIANDFTPRKTSLNEARREEFAGHPYLSSREAAAIVAYRFKHGNFASVEDLRKVQGIDSLNFERLKPYLKVD